MGENDSRADGGDRALAELDAAISVLEARRRQLRRSRARVPPTGQPSRLETSPTSPGPAYTASRALADYRPHSLTGRSIDHLRGLRSLAASPERTAADVRRARSLVSWLRRNDRKVSSALHDVLQDFKWLLGIPLDGA